VRRLRPFLVVICGLERGGRHFQEDMTGRDALGRTVPALLWWRLEVARWVVYRSDSAPDHPEDKARGRWQAMTVSNLLARTSLRSCSRRCLPHSRDSRAAICYL
jgi:hypothetical protein